MTDILEFISWVSIFTAIFAGNPVAWIVLAGCIVLALMGAKKAQNSAVRIIAAVIAVVLIVILALGIYGFVQFMQLDIQFQPGTFGSL